MRTVVDKVGLLEPTCANPECSDLTLQSVLECEQPHLMPNPTAFDGYIDQPVQESSTALIHYLRSRSSVRGDQPAPVQ